MWQILKTLLIQGILKKTALRSVAWLAWILPVGFILKWVGLPLLVILGVIALPVVTLLLLIGLPIFVVILFGGTILTFTGAVLTMGLAILKIAVPLFLILVLTRFLLRAAFAKAGSSAAV